MQACALLMVLACVGVGWGQGSKPKELRIAAASDLQPVMPAVAEAYEKATGVKLLVSFGSSSTLATQIVNGAPVDVFLSADYVASGEGSGGGDGGYEGADAVCEGDAGVVGEEGLGAAADYDRYDLGQAGEADCGGG